MPNRFVYPAELEDAEPDDGPGLGGGVKGLGATLAAFAACLSFGTFPRRFDVSWSLFLRERNHKSSERHDITSV